MIYQRIIFVCALMFLFALQSQSQDKPLVLASASMIADMAINVGGAFADVQSIVPIGGDPHTYEPTPKDAQLVNKADLVLVNGLTFEGWLLELVENSGTSAKVITVTDGIKAIQSLDYENAYDPHAWMDASLGLQYVRNIASSMSKLIPNKKEEIQFNAEVYLNQLKDLDASIMQEIESIPKEHRILITSHDAFQYYGRRYGLDLQSVLGTSTDAQAQTSDIVRLKKVIESSKVPAVFIESTVNPKLIKQLASDTGLSLGGKLFADSLGEPDGPAGTYIDMLMYNTSTIVKALTEGAVMTESDQASSSNRWLYLGFGLLFLMGFVLMILKLNRG